MSPHLGLVYPHTGSLSPQRAPAPQPDGRHSLCLRRRGPLWPRGPITCHFFRCEIGKCGASQGPKVELSGREIHTYLFALHRAYHPDLLSRSLATRGTWNRSLWHSSRSVWWFDGHVKGFPKGQSRRNVTLASFSTVNDHPGSLHTLHTHSGTLSGQ